MLVIDGHLDLAMNALSWNRDLERPVAETRALEVGMAQKGRACGTVAVPEMRQGEVGVCLATVIARVARAGNPLSGYPTAEIAYAIAQGQRYYYRALEARGQLRLIRDWPALAAQAEAWGVGRPDPDPNATTHFVGTRPTPNAPPPIGVILCMEGADPILSPEQVEEWWDDGLRVVGPAHYGVSAYAHGTGTPGPLTPRGPALLGAMEQRGMILDLTHLADDSFWQALERFGGTVLASHNNCRALVPGDRQFSDEQLKALIERDAVVGAAMDAWMLYPAWIKGETENSVVNLEAVVDNLDHVCQLAGNSRHAAIGTDLDGGYGTEQCPNDLDTIADLQKIPDLLRARGYGEEDITNIMHGNWLRLFQRAWT